MKHLTLLALGVLPAAASAQFYGFDQGSMGWGVFNVGMSGHIVNPGAGGALAFDTANGEPAPSIRLTDLAAETCAGAPPEALGDRAGLYGSTIAWDMFVRTTDAGGYSPVVIAGAAITLYFEPSEPPLNIWVHRVAPLLPGPWRVNGETARAATEAELRAVLADVRGIYLRAEYKTGPDDTNLDNINIGEVPVGCPADFNGDGFLDFFDYDDYVACFESGSCPPGKTADFNGDGFADFFDYDDFVAAFEVGC